MAQASNVIAFPGSPVSERAALARSRKEKLRNIRVPRAGDDRVFSYILRHHIAVEEGRTKDAALFLRCILFGGAQTRKGMIAMAKYLAGLTHIEFATGTPLEVMSAIDGQPLVNGFFNSLASQLRRMKSEFPSEKRTRAKSG